MFWQIGSSATIGVESKLVGNILAVASITLVSGASLDGRALALGGAVTMDHNTVSVCGSGGSIPLPTGCRVKVICHDHHDKDCDHHEKDGDRCDKDDGSPKAVRFSGIGITVTDGLSEARNAPSSRGNTQFRK